MAKEAIGTVFRFLGTLMITDIRTGGDRLLSTDSS